MTRRRKILLVSALAGAVAIVLGLRLSASRLVWSRIASSAHDHYGVDLAIDSLSLSLRSGRATARGLRVTDAGAAVLEADEVELSASIRDILGKTYDFRELIVTRPVLHVVVEPDERTNLGRILARRKQTGRPADLVLFREARIVDGRCVLDDAQTDPEHPARLLFESIALSLAELQVSGPARPSAIGDFRFDALLVQKDAPARITLVGWSPALTSKLTIALHAAITGLELEQIPQYVKKSTRQALGGDVLHLVGAMRAQDGVIEDGAVAAEVVASGAGYALRFGGTTSNVVFDKDSKLAALFQLPFARLGQLGDVALTSTWGVAVDLGTGVIGAGESVVGGVAGTLGSMIRLDPLGALEAAGSGVVGGVKALGGGILGGVKRILGVGESRAEKAEKEAKQEIEFGALHAQCRRAMLEAALVSAEESSGERRQRIEKELEATTPASGETVDGEGR